MGEGQRGAQEREGASFRGAGNCVVRRELRRKKEFEKC